MFRKKLIASLAAAVMALGIAGCGGGSDGKGGAKPDVLRIGLGVGPVTLDPAKDAAGLPNVMRSLTNEALFHLNADKSASPALVSDSGYVGKGNTTFELTLKKGIRFTDGEPLNAAAVKTWLLYFAKAGGPFASNLSIKSIETQGDYKLTLHLASPNPIVPVILSQYGNGGAVSSPKAVAHPADLAKTTYGVGPYVIDSSQTVAGDHYTLVPSKYYYDKSAIRFKKVTVKVISDKSAMLRAFQAGQLDFGSLDPTVAAAAAKSGVKVMHWASGTVIVSLLDSKGSLAPALGDVRVRQALNYAVNRKAIAKAMVGEFGAPTSQLQMSDTDPALNDRYPYDPQKAKTLLAEAGYKDGFSMKVVDGGTASVIGDATMQAVAKDWEAIGVKVQVKAATTDFVALALSKKFSGIEWPPDAVPTWMGYSLFWGPKASLNPFGVVNPELDRLFELGRSQSGDEAAETFAKLSSTVTEQALNVPIYTADTIWGMNKHLTGIDKGTWMPFAADFGWKS
ncbi:ABC transporter substrate-binding protein [Aeromicrobium sp. Root344]|uniref:ABC transporter substrate-binding protein n=1 Tax=Aeromicrobium sp. Root344 TaxID=1736521 RepID=UPI0009E8B127|nr:ABC transporter substrate-binding protein [Aeromicrobium sp. Root344]